MKLIIIAALIASALAAEYDSPQFVKSVKGVHSNYQYKGGDTTRFFGYNNSDSYNHGYATRPQVPAINFEVGVCYKEVPTASLVRDPAHIPAGNGSRPDLSRIRTCCEGYKRNIYNYLVCEPFCSKECVNGLCVAPETCSCFPDHVKNLGGFCVATCPIGCQNGHCSGGECLCKEGFKLDTDGKFCEPICRGNCGGLGNCTAPNTCECKPGYSSSSDGSCKVPCNNCRDGECVEPNVCRCRPGYTLIKGVCEPQCNQNCGTGRCIAPNVCSPSAPNPNSGHQMHTYPPSPRPTLNHNTVPGQQPSSYPYGQYPENPQYPVYPISRNVTYPSNHTFYPGSQVTTNKPSSYHGHESQYPSLYPQLPTNQFTQETLNQYPTDQFPQSNTNQFPQSNLNQFPQETLNQFPSNPSSRDQSTFHSQSRETSNFTTQSQYPLYPGNQMKPQQNQQSTNYPYQSTNGYPYPQVPQSQSTQVYPYPNPQKSNSTSYHQGPNSYPTNPPPTTFQPGQGSYGYRQESQYEQSQETESLCSGGCINGVCVGRNQCKCNPGYILDDDDPTGKRCGPHCPGGCPNGFCVAPYSCACNEGYYKDPSIKGRAICIKRLR